MTTIADIPTTCQLNNRAGAWSIGNDLAGNNEVRGRWQVPYADLLTFREKMLYTTQNFIINPDPLVQITRVSPMVCPLDKSLIALTVEATNLQGNQKRPLNGDAGWEVLNGVWSPSAVTPPFPMWDVIVRFGRVPYQTTGDNPFLSVTKEDRIDRRTVPNHPYWLQDNDGNLIEWVAQDLALPAGTFLYRVTWHEIIDLPSAEAVFAPILDCVNDSTIVIPLIGTPCASGTLHCAGGSASSSINLGNIVKSELSASLAYFPRGWNRAVSSVPPFAGQYLNVMSSNGPPYPSANFLPVFNPAV